MLKRVPSPTFSPCAICTAWIQILLSLSHLSHNSLNIIRTKWWSSSPIVSLTFSSCIWTCPLNHSWYLIRKLYYSCLCTMFQWYFHCECTIYSIPTTTPAAQPIAVLSYYLSARYCSYMLRHALATCHSIIFSHPISSCAIADPMNFSGSISSLWNFTCPFPLTNVKRELQRFGAFPDWQVSWKIAEFPHQTSPPSPCPSNVTGNMYPPTIIISCSRGIAHILPLSIYVASCLSQKFTNMLGYPKT